MPTITAPNIEVTQVVTGFIYEISISEDDSGSGITRLEIGPYFFAGVAPRVEYPEAVTNELAPPGWSQIRWVTDTKGQSWLRYEGGVIKSGDDEALFQFTSNHKAAGGNGPRLVVWHGTRSETFDLSVPDYSTDPPLRNSRHDSTGLGLVYRKSGCAPQFLLGCMVFMGCVAFLMR